MHELNATQEGCLKALLFLQCTDRLSRPASEIQPFPSPPIYIAFKAGDLASAHYVPAHPACLASLLDQHEALAAELMQASIYPDAKHALLGDVLMVLWARGRMQFLAILSLPS